MKIFLFIFLFFTNRVISVFTRHLNVLDERSFKCQTSESGKILQKIRALMKHPEQFDDYWSTTAIQAYIIPMNDAHQSEYIGEQDKRIQFITNFTGSAGEAVITDNDAAFWTDSRYHLQSEKQIDLNCWTLMKNGNNSNEPVPSISSWLASKLPEESSNVGIDPFLISSSKYQKISNELENKNHKLISVKMNLIDQIWINKPIINKTEIFPLNIKYSGKSSNEKITELREKLVENDAEFIVITTLDDIAWLLNLRGSDITYNPVFFSYVLISKTELYLFVDEEKITSSVLRQLHNEEVNFQIRPYEDILNGIDSICNKTTGKIMITDAISQAIYEKIPENRRLTTKNHIARMKAVKNDIEAENMNQAHIRDGYALIQYLHWLNSSIDSITVTEISGAEKLEEFRSQLENYRGLSFETISAVGSNAAMAHYTPSKETDRQITREEIYLVDSGGQYWDGTTDVTRTMHFGTPTDFEKECFTRVLKGFIALATSVFPPGTALSYFDYVARRSLWQSGLDYGHGTGHGIGAYLYVHEYPPSIGQTSGSDPGALVNMFTSDEPGYYRDGEFGIRIEDVIQVVKSDIPNAFLGKGALTFKSVTYAPLQTKMIDTNLLNKEEARYINDLNKRIVDIVGEMLLKNNYKDTYNWLVAETTPVTANG